MCGIRDISTHTPLAGRDQPVLLSGSDHVILLTRPLRDVTFRDPSISSCCRISTHTPLAGRDICPSGIDTSMCPFLLTRPLRDVTVKNFTDADIMVISTHTPLAGRDGLPLSCYGELGISTHTPLAGRDYQGGFYSVNPW